MLFQTSVNRRLRHNRGKANGPSTRKRSGKTIHGLSDHLGCWTEGAKPGLTRKDAAESVAVQQTGRIGRCRAAMTTVVVGGVEHGVALVANGRFDDEVTHGKPLFWDCGAIDSYGLAACPITSILAFITEHGRG